MLFSPRIAEIRKITFPPERERRTEMVNTAQTNRLIEKINRLRLVYQNFLVRDRESIQAEICEPEHACYVPPAEGVFRPIQEGCKWGADGAYAWFRLTFEIPRRMEGQKIYLSGESGAVESLIFIDGAPVGLFDRVAGASSPEFRRHAYFELPAALRGEKRIFVEGYGGHRVANCMPYDRECYYGLQPFAHPRTFRGFEIVVFDKDVEKFIDLLYLLDSLYKSQKDPFTKGELCDLYEEILKKIELMPEESAYSSSVKQTNALIEDFFEARKQKSPLAYAGLVGHSHLDTAWLWTKEETKRKAARTVSNAVAVLERNKQYRFMFESALHLSWIKEYYPVLFDRVKKLVAEGRFEPNGGVWVECDCNLTSGESLVRQFLYGQAFYHENFAYRADTFWLPDTFGYSAALPQILKQCGISYFCTTKMSWNDTTRFPYDSFRWRGIDGSEVTAHLHCLHVAADPVTIVEQTDKIANKQLSRQTLIAYGYGDGGGGPDEKMVECALASCELPYLPETEHTTVSDFMNRLSKQKKLPVYSGELYLELHRGTLTSLHEIKLLNREFESALHDLEFAIAVASKEKKRDRAISEILYKTLLVNQFHDILPGTSINEVNDVAIAENRKGISSCRSMTKTLLAGDKEDVIEFVNTLSFPRREVMTLEGEVGLEGIETQTYVDLDGKTKTDALVQVEAFSSVGLKRTIPVRKDSVFIYTERELETPFYRVCFDEKGCIVSLFDKSAKRLVAERKINEYCLYDDVPNAYDNWDIDADYLLGNCKKAVCINSEIVSAGALELIIRSSFQISEKSKLVCDTVFYADLKRIDFRCRLDWHERHKLLKTCFSLNILTEMLKSEIQFGYLDRIMRENYAEESAKYEVSNQKWSDVSETNYGVALLNRSKYGIGYREGTLSLSLMKGGTHPDTRADEGIRYFQYALLPHEGAFSAQNTVQPAYSFQNPFVLCRGGKALNPIVKITAPNIICETVKVSEDGEDTILRCFESEKSRTVTALHFGQRYDVFVCNLLEEILLPIASDCVSTEMEFAPFEMKTIRLHRKENSISS